MEALSYYTGQILELIQPRIFKEIYELRYGEKIIGTITFPKMFSSTAEVKIANSIWEIRSESFWKGTLGVYKQGNELPYVQYVPRNYRQAEIRFYRGDFLNVQQYYFKNIIELRDSMEEIILTVRSKTGWKKKYLVEIIRQNKIADENPWLVFLLCYIIMKKEKRAQGAL